LTAGYRSSTLGAGEAGTAPYGAFLQEMLGARARVAISGICGELTGEMVLRFRRDVLARAPAYVVVLGGTNDLGVNARPAEIMRNLLKMYESALASGVQPVPVTVPSIRVEELEDDAGAEGRRWIQDHIRRREILNGLIGDYCGRRGLGYVDLFAATAEPDTLLLAAPYSDDGLHLTVGGYRLLASLLHARIFAAIP
jgi:acyl-CoA thioesterase-1